MSKLHDIRQMMRLYAVTDRAWVGKQTLLEQVEDALRGGATCVQLREKELPLEEFLREAAEVKEICRKYNVPLIINDHAEIALRIGADGVHVGQEDMNAAEIRASLSAGQRADFIIGVTAKTVAAAQKAQRDGADYIGSGAMFGSLTKKNARHMTVGQLSEICAAVDIPVVAIGGINRENCGSLRASGASENIFEETRLLRQKADELFGN